MLRRGLPLYRYLRRRRVERARQMLVETESCLAQVAFACGFSSQGQFTTTFTRRMGISPGRWRVALRG